MNYLLYFFSNINYSVICIHEIVDLLKEKVSIILIYDPSSNTKTLMKHESKQKARPLKKDVVVLCFSQH